MPATCVQYKYGLNYLVKFCVNSGNATSVIKKDREPAIVAPKKVAMKICAKEYGKNIIAETSPSRDSQSNGVAENAVKTTKGLCRTLRHSVEELHNIVLGPQHPCLPFVVKYAGVLLTHGFVGKDGRTPYERMRGNRWRKSLPAFGEAVMWLLAGEKRSRLVNRWGDGIFFGLLEEGPELLAGTEPGVLKARSVKRLSDADRKDPDRFKAIKDAPWCLAPGKMAADDDDVPGNLNIVIGKAVPDANLPSRPLAAEGPASRRLYIRRGD